MQVKEDDFDELFARKLGNMEVAPPEDGWVRIENELNRRSRAIRRYWMIAASFALILSATATMVYIQNTIYTDTEQTMVAIVQENTPQISDSQHPAIQTEPLATQPVAQWNKQQAESLIVEQHATNGISQNQTSTQSGSISQQESFQDALQDDVVVPDIAVPDIAVPVADVPISEIAISEATGDMQSIPSNIPVYMDSWDKMLKSQPIKESLRKTMYDKIAQIRIENQEKKEENKLAIASTTIPVHDEISYFDITGSYTKSQPRNRWAITGQFAPVFSYRAISSVPGGMRKSEFDDAESPLLAYSGGVTLSRKVVSRLSVQIGIYYSQMGQSINNLYPVSNMPIGMSSINQYSKNIFKTSSGSVTATSNLKSDTSYDAYFSSESPSTSNSVSVANNDSPSKYRLVEHLDYIEIPLMLRYKIIDKKLNFSFLGGMSTNILVNNNIFIDNGNELLKGGSILMARPVNYSSSLGLGIGYQISRNLSVEIEPLFKYFLQSYTTNSQISSNPYAFGMFTGVVYRF